MTIQHMCWIQNSLLSTPPDQTRIPRCLSIRLSYSACGHMKTKRYSPRPQTRKLLPKLPWQSHKFRRKMPAGHRICVGTKWLLIIIRRSSSFFLLGARRFRFNNLCTLVGETFSLQVGADDSFSQWILYLSSRV